MGEDIKVSVIIPVYNAEKYLRQCLDSVVNQTLREIEIICVDDGSTDGSLDILREYERKDSRVHILTQKNQYAGVARNHGMEIATGEYYVFWDSDDFFELQALEKMYEKIRLSNADICLCGADSYNTQTNIYTPAPWWLNLQFLEQKSIYSFSINPNNIFRVTNTAPWTKLFSAKFINGYKIQFQALPRANDIYFVMTSMALAETFAVVDEVLIHYRVGNKSSLQSNNKLSPLAFCDALSAVKDKLLEQDVFDCFSLSFRNSALSHFNYNLKKAENDYVTAMVIKSAFLEKYSQYYHINTLTAETAYIQNDYVGFFSLIQANPLEQTLFDCYFRANDVPTVSIIIPIYNAEKYIEKCLLSIINQTYRNIEIICVDDRSCDSSLSIIRRLANDDDRLIIIGDFSHKQGCGGARNYGLETARGKYVWFIDSDDYISEDAVEKLVSFMETKPNVDFVGFNATAFVEDKSGFHEVDRGAINRDWPKNTTLLLPNCNNLPNTINGSTVTLFFKRKCVDNFRFRKNVCFEDADFSFDLFTSKFNYCELDYSPYHRRIREDSITGTNAAGINSGSICGRIIAAQEIKRIISEKNLPLSHFSVKWFIKWVKFAVSLYQSHPQYRTADMDNIEKSLVKYLNELESATDNAVKSQSKYRPDIIVSLTSYPKRINCVSIPIKEILAQTVKADKVILWLAKEQFPNLEQDLPAELIELTNMGLEIRWCDDDLKPHKKYYYAIQEFRDSIIITIDDDVHYSKYTIEKLLDSYKKYPRAVSALRTRLLVKDKTSASGFAPYKNWKIENHNKVEVPSMLLLPTGVSGVLYPPHCLHDVLFRKDIIFSSCLYADDLWLKVCQILQGTPVVAVKNYDKISYIEGSQADALWKKNVDNAENDKQFENILNFVYSKIMEKDKFIYRIFDNSGDCYPLTNEAEQIRNSISYKIGRFITYIPRKTRGVLKCFREHGFIFTVNEIVHVLRFKYRLIVSYVKKIPGVFRCFRDHGFRYTMNEIIGVIKRKK